MSFLSCDWLFTNTDEREPINLKNITSNSPAFRQAEQQHIIDTLFRVVPASSSENTVQAVSDSVFVFAGKKKE
jgi:hypothetical protein